MRKKSGTTKPPAEQVVKDIRRKTRKHHSAEEKIRIVLEGLRGERLHALTSTGSPARTSQRTEPCVCAT